MTIDESRDSVRARGHSCIVRTEVDRGDEGVDCHHFDRLDNGAVETSDQASGTPTGRAQDKEWTVRRRSAGIIGASRL
jgi:hypothetical protein